MVPMARPRNKPLDYAVYVAMRMLAAMVHMFSWEANYRAAAFLAELLWRFDHRHRRRALGHLKRSFPDWTERRVSQVAHASMRSLAYLGLEFLFTSRKITPGRWRRHVRLHNMNEALRLLVERRTGLVLITGHFGNWELAGYTLATLGFANTAIARPLDNPYVNEYVLGQREKRGLRILDKKGAASEVDDLLDAGGLVCFIADQDAGRKGVFVDFFGRPASTYKSIALMAMRHNSPVVVTYGRRLAPRFQFEIGVERIIHPREWADKDDPLHWITQAYTRALEDLARRNPTQYLWVHRRWKHTPKGTADPVGGIG